MRNHKTLTRGILALAVLGMVTAALVASPVGAATNVTKKKAKNIAKKQVNQLAPGIATGIANTVVGANGGIINKFHEGELDIGGDGLDVTSGLVTTLPLTAGNWFVQAKMGMRGDSSGQQGGTCRLSAGGVSDLFDQTTIAGSGLAEKEVDVLNVAVTLAAAANAELRCTDLAGPGGSVRIDHVQLTAIKAPSLTSTGF